MRREIGGHYSMYRSEIDVFSDGRTDQNTATKYCDFVTSGTGLIVHASVIIVGVVREIHRIFTTASCSKHEFR